MASVASPLRFGRAPASPGHLRSERAAAERAALQSLELDRQAEADLRVLEDCFTHCPGCGRGAREFREGCRSGTVACEILRVELEQERGTLRHRIRQLEAERGDYRRREEQLRAKLRAVEVQRERLHGQLEEHVQEGRARSLSALERALPKSVIALSGVTVTACFGGWRQLLERRRKELLETQRSQLAAVQQRTLQGVLGSWEQSSSRALRRTSFTAWLMVAIASHAERETRRRERRRCRSILEGVLEGSSAAEARASLSRLWAGWRLSLELARRDRLGDEQRRRAQHGQSQFDRAMGVWSDSANEFHLRVCLAGWGWACSGSKAAKAEKDRRAAVAQQALAKYMMSETSGMMQFAFTCWRDVLVERRQDAERQQKEQAGAAAAALQQRQYQRALESWAKGNERTLRRSCFDGWIGAALSTKEQQKLMDDQRAHREAVAVKAFSKMFAESANSILQVSWFAWSGLLEEKRREALLAEKQRLEALQQAQFERALSCWSNSSSKVMRISCFKAWLQAVDDAKRERDQEAVERTQRSEVACRALAKFLEAETSAVTRFTYDAWRKLLDQKRQEEIDAERHRMKDMEQRQFAKAMSCMAQSSERVLRRSVFVSWAEQWREEKRAAEENARRSEVAMRALSKFVQADGENLLRLAWGAWVRLREDKLREEIDAERHRMQQTSAKQFERALGVFANSNLKMLQQSCFVAWNVSAQAAKQELQMRAQKSAAAMKTLSKMLSQEGGSLTWVGFRSWSLYMEETQRENNEAARSKLELLQKKQFESALGCLAQSSDRVVRRSSFIAWVEQVSDTKKKIEEMTRRSEAAMKALRRMCSGNDEGLLRLTVNTWNVFLQELRREAIEADRHRMKHMQQRQFEGALRALAGSSDRTVLMSSFFEWREVWTVAQHEQAVDMQEKAKRNAVAMASLSQMCSADDGALQRVSFSTWREELFKMRKERMAEERTKLEEVQLKKIEGTLAAIARVSDKGIQAMAFSAWWRDIEEDRARREAELQEKMKRAAVAMQALQKMTTASDSSNLRMGFNGWRDVLQLKVLDQIQAEKQRMEDMQKKQFESALRCMAQSSGRALRSSAFVVWRDYTVEEQTARHVEMEEKTKKSAAALAAVAQVCSADKDSLLKVCIKCWDDLAVKARKEKIDAERQRMKAAQIKGVEKAMFSMLQSNNEVLIKTVFSSWLSDFREEKAEREDRLREQAKKSEAALQALARMCNGNDGANLRMCVGAWAKVMEEKKKEAIEEEIRRLKAMHLAQAESALGSLAASSDSVLLRTTFSSWRTDINDAKRVRQIEMQEKAKRSEVAMKSLAKFCAANDSQSMHMCFAGWREILDLKRKEQIQQEREKLLQMQAKQFEKTIGALAGSSERSLKGACLHAWYDSFCKERDRKAIEMAEKAKRSEVAIRSLAKFCQAEQQGGLMMCISAWCQVLEEKRKEAVRQEADRIKNAQKAQFDRALKVWSQSSEKAMRRDAWDAWLGTVSETRLRKKLTDEQRSKSTLTTQKAIQKFLHSQTTGSCQLCLTAWRHVLEERVKLAQEAEHHRLLQQRRSFESEAEDRSLRSMIGCRFGAVTRSRRCRTLFLGWLATVCESRGRASPLRVRAERSLSPKFMKASKHTTVGALLASAQAQAECRDPRVRRALQLHSERRLFV